MSIGLSRAGRIGRRKGRRCPLGRWTRENVVFIPLRRYFNSAFAAETKWHRKYLVFLLCFFFIFIHVAIHLMQPAQPRNANLGTIIGLYLFMATGIFLLLQALDTLKKTASLLKRAALALVTGAAFVVWLFVLLLWLLNVFGF